VEKAADEPKAAAPAEEAQAAPAPPADTKEEGRPATAPSASPLRKLLEAASPPPAALQAEKTPSEAASSDAPKSAVPEDTLSSAYNQTPPERRPQSNSPPPTAAPSPMSAGTLQKMKDQGLYRNQYFKDAECFDCAHKFKVSRSSRSATCPQCGATVPMEDIEINMPSHHKVKTRGDVLIRKRGHLVTEKVVCKDLRCYGTLEADVEASGDAIFRSTGTVVGQVRCKRLIIEKGCDVVFQTPVQAQEMEIHARVTGSLVSSGPILIGGNGCANGDVTARSVSIEPGGELNGAMNIVRSGKAKAKPDPAQEELPLAP
jgi:cytoskeletal protein CcmA (bactofilin family)/ribosomal protein S27E